MMVNSPTSPGPVFIDLPADQALHGDPPQAEIWYVTCVVVGAERRFAVQAILTASPSGKLFTSLSLADLGHQREWSSVDRFDLGAITVSTDHLEISTPKVGLTGTTDEMAFRAEIDGNTAVLTLRRRYPVLYNCGTGVFPYFHGPTYQYAFAGLEVTGTISVEGTPVPVTGGGWFDRQWAASRDAFGTKQGFTWFGLCLDNGHNLSFWQTTGPAAKTWATLVQPDGAHVVASASATAHPARPERSYPNGWTLCLPSLDATLQISHEKVHDEHRFYSGVCTVDGTYRATPIHGYGVVDYVPE